MTDSAKQKAYEAEKSRQDAARKTRRNIECIPPNKKCGGRCIPPDWDCRLKNEGSDKHLTAVKTDPLKGAASIQRGVTRLTKGVVTGNIEAVQSGRNSITRGIVTITPGTLQEKKELRAKIERNTRFIGTAFLIGVGGFALHMQAMKFRYYKEGVGDKISIFARNGFNAALDAFPVLGTIRDNNRLAAAVNTKRTVEAILKGETSGPAQLEMTLSGEGATQLSRIKKSGAQAYVAMDRVLSEYDRLAREETDPSKKNFLSWDKGHRTAFLGITRTTSNNEFIKNTELSIYAQPAGENFLREAYGLKGKTGSNLRRELGDRFRSERADYYRYAKQNGFKLLGGKDPYMDADTATRFAAFASEHLRDQATIHDLVQVHIRSIVSRGGPQKRADTVYVDTIKGFSDYYKEAAKLSISDGNSPIIREQRKLVENADQARARDLAARMKLTKINNIGPSVSEVIRRKYYATKVIGPTRNTFTLTDRLFRAAAGELVGRPVNSITEAQQVFRDKGITGAVLQTTQQAKKKKSKKQIEEEQKQQRLKSMTELAKKYEEQGLSPVAAMKAAVKEMKERGDELLEARFDFKDSNKGKPCGESYISKNKKCTKNTSQQTKESEKNKTLKKVAIAGAVGGAAVGAAFLLKKAKLNEFGTLNDLSDLRLKVRKRKFEFQIKNQAAMSADQIASAVGSLKGHKGVLNENVERFEAFAKLQGLRADGKGFLKEMESNLASEIGPATSRTTMDAIKMQINMGICDGMASPFSNSIYVRSSRKDINKLTADPKNVVQTINDFQDRRKKDPATEVKLNDAGKRLFATYRNANDGDTHEFIAMVHEAAHMAHFRATRNYLIGFGLQKPPSATVMATLINPKGEKGLVDQLEKASSNYGRSDILGDRAETFAELSVLYMASGKRFKEEYPLAYNWVDTIWKLATKQ